MTRQEHLSYLINCEGVAPVLLRGRDFSLDDSKLGTALAAALRPRLADLVDIALAAYVLDRSQRRPGARETSGGRAWSRRINARIGVRDPPFWTEHKGSLAALLHWLTDDGWALEFTRFTGLPLGIEVEARLPLALDGADCVALFSGGLDSLAGALLAFDAGRRPLLLSIETNSRMASTQRGLRQLLRTHWPQAVSATAAVELHGGESQEASQRARAFMFLALAGVVAASSGLDRVEVYENGVGAIALPYLANQEGAHTTKAMHPETLARFAALVTVVAGTPIHYVNPSLWSTKAELCRRIPSGQQCLIRDSESCDTAFTYRGEGAPRCGVCTSCLLRRQALWAAGLEALDRCQVVRTDLLGDGCRPEPAAAASLLSMLDQAQRIQTALREEDPWARLTQRFPRLLDFASSGQEQQACVGLYDRYVDEWRFFPSPFVEQYLVRRSDYARSAQGDGPLD